MGHTERGDDDEASFENAVRVAHDRLVGGDRVASEELAQLLLGPLVARLVRRWPRWRHTDVLHDVAVEVLLNYLDAPERYEPGRGSLLSWLDFAAHRDLTNLYRSGKRRSLINTPPLSALGNPERPAIAELPARVTPLGLSRIAPDPDDVERLDLRKMWGRIRQACPDEKERELIWACFVEGERSSERIARILGVEHLPVADRRRRVKDARDVARRKLRRMELGDDGND